MARPIRIEVAGGWYHVSARGNEQRRIYADDRDRPDPKSFSSLTGTNPLADATEGIARCLKAHYGTIGRAYAWLLSISR